jgi:hypothetical protein
MAELQTAATAFIEMAHNIVWCTVATVDPSGNPRTRILHPIWEWNGETLTGWIATDPTSYKASHLAAHPVVSLTYWSPNHDTCSAECRARWTNDLVDKQLGWDRFMNAPAPVGYDPSIVPYWTSPEADRFGILRLDPYRLRVMPGTVMTAGTGEVHVWRE